jgi:hypothetical protein
MRRLVWLVFRRLLEGSLFPLGCVILGWCLWYVVMRRGLFEFCDNDDYDYVCEIMIYLGLTVLHAYFVLV